jgi:ribosomal protein S18 acetylase RimI-like enzyme
VFYIQDIIVRPEYQGLGLGTTIMQSVMAFIEKHAVPGTFIGLMSAKGKEGFYHRLGFTERPSEDVGAGMELRWPRQPAVNV